MKNASSLCPVNIYHSLVGLLQNAVPLILRIVFGWCFIMNGWSKLHDLTKTAGFFKSIGIVAPAFSAAFIGGLEFLGGALLILGLGTRLFAFLLASTMVVAYFTAHYEALFDLKAFMQAAPFSFLVATLALAAWGPGKLALDSLKGCKNCSCKSC